jgi:hypothetical protein
VTPPGSPDVSVRELAPRPVDSGRPSPGLRASAARLRRPNLFVIGAMKSGSRFLRRLLDLHPAIYMARPEEPSYFVPQEQLHALWPSMWDRGYWRCEEAYLRLFEPAGDVPLLGEASTNYSKIPLATGVPERIARFAPDARFVYVMRDPVERTMSHYWHMVRFQGEHRPMLAALQADPGYLAVSHYAMQLAPYLALFGRERLFTLTYEELTQQTESTIRRVYAWLGVDPMVELAPGYDASENATPTEVLQYFALGGLVQRLRWSRQIRWLVPHMSSKLRAAAKLILSETVRRDTIDTSAAIAFLRSAQQPQTVELSAMLGRDFPEWMALWGASAA